MAEVHVLPGVERTDLLDLPDDETVLRQALDQGLRDVIIVGRAPDGTLYIASSIADTDRCIGLVYRAATEMAQSHVEVGPFNTEGDNGGSI